LNAWLDANGAMGPPSLFGGPADAEAAPPAESGPGWSVAIGELSVDDYGVAFEDRRFEQPFAFAAESIKARIQKLSLSGGAPMTLNAELVLPDNGSLKATGSVALSPLAVDLDVQLAGLGLERFQPYVAGAFRVGIEGGRASADGHVAVQAVDGQPPMVAYNGKAAVQELSVTDNVRSEDLVKWATLQLNDIAYASRPPSLQIKEAVVDQAYARILIDKEGKLNLSQLSVAPAAEATAPAAPADTAEAQGGPAMAVTIDRLAINDGLTDFADFSIQPNVATGIHNLNGEVQGLSSDPGARSKMRLEGKVDKHSPAKISGIINPFHPATQTDVTVSFDNVNLTIFTPYSARFAGYKIKRGKASIDLVYRVEAGRLQAENQIILDQLTLGERVASPEATSLPVTLAVALLKDRNGRINISLPVRGNLDDPKFSYRAIVAKALIDLIAKTVASPFSIVGSLADFKREELEYVAFAPGSDDLDAEEQKKLDAMSEALKERPALRLEVSGGVDPATDTAALGVSELTKNLKREKKAELTKKGAAVPKKLSEIELSAAEQDRLFSKRYKASFGTDPPRDAQGAITEAARRALADSFTIDEGALRELAKKRAAAVQDHLISRGIENDRIFVLESDLKKSEQEGKVRSDLSLTS
jgi:outer membrane protein OmpA-like peptidoglycan-associated protein